MPIIRLWNAVGLFLIIEYSSGIVYSNQTGGTLCSHPELEGVVVPLRNDIDETGRLLSPENELYKYFEGPKYCGTGATDGLDLEDVSFIESVLEKYRLSSFISIDRSRLADSHEAWVYVKVEREEPYEDILKRWEDTLKGFSGFGPYPRSGVLTWSNTD
jgi:Family of unknown function (DUF6210)